MGDEEKMNPIVGMLITASCGTNDQHDVIQAHMDEYFKRWPSYKDKFTELEWYHIFLDFHDKVRVPKQPESDVMEHAMIMAHEYADSNYDIERHPHKWLERYQYYLKQHYSLIKK